MASCPSGSAACESGWTSFGGSCYKRMDRLGGGAFPTFEQCVQSCEAEGAALPCITDECTNDFVVNEFGGTPEGGIWLGLYQTPNTLDPTAGWSNWAAEGCVSNYTKWYPNYLNDAGCVQEMCAVAWRTLPAGGFWDVSWNTHWYDWTCFDGETHSVDCVCAKAPADAAAHEQRTHTAALASDLPSLMRDTSDQFRADKLAQAGGGASNSTIAMCNALSTAPGASSSSSSSSSLWTPYGDKCYGEPAGVGARLTFGECSAVCAAANATLPCVVDGCHSYWLAALAGTSQWLGTYQAASIGTWASMPLAGWNEHWAAAGCASTFSGWRTWLIGDGVPDDYGFMQEACAVVAPRQPWDDQRCSARHACVCEYPGAFAANFSSDLARLEREDAMLPHGRVVVGLTTACVVLIAVALGSRVAWLLTKRSGRTGRTRCGATSSGSTFSTWRPRRCIGGTVRRGAWVWGGAMRRAAGAAVCARAARAAPTSATSGALRARRAASASWRSRPRSSAAGRRTPPSG